MKENSCLFCERDDAEKHSLTDEYELCYAKRDKNPVSSWHALIIPKRHVESFFELTPEELLQCFDLLKKVKNIIQEKYRPDGFNIGINEGEAAGRTIHHLHIHLIPRYRGDVENPRGGIRHIIPWKGDY